MAIDIEQLLNAEPEEKDNLTNEDVRRILRDVGTEDRVEKLEERMSRLEQNPISRDVDIKSKDIIVDIVADKFIDLVWQNTLEYQYDGVSIDGLDTAGTVVISTTAGSTGLTTAGSGVSAATLFNAFELTGGSSLGVETRVRFVVSFDSTTLQNVELFFGATAGDSFGFEVEDATLNATATDNGTEVTFDTGKTINTSDQFKLEAIFIPGERIDYFVEDKLVGSLSAGIPNTLAYQWKAIITEQEAVAKTLFVHSVRFLQSNVNR